MIAESSIAKTVFNFFTVCAASFLVYLDIEVETYSIYAVLLIIDLFTGWIKAGKLGEPRTSVRMKYGILTKLMLLLMPIVLALGAKAVGVEFKTILDVCMTILVLSEVYSIIGNMYTIKSGGELPEYDAIAMIGGKIRTFLIRLAGEKA
ncbi:phage holin family protein [Sulfurimonas sp.]|uniref:phage holin family protein n=1 Tax=Sulfurimonas sp. TaxID=2022749 RepID=UPI00356754D1